MCLCSYRTITELLLLSRPYYEYLLWVSINWRPISPELRDTTRARKRALNNNFLFTWKYRLKATRLYIKVFFIKPWLLDINNRNVHRSLVYLVSATYLGPFIPEPSQTPLGPVLLQRLQSANYQEVLASPKCLHLRRPTVLRQSLLLHLPHPCLMSLTPL